MTSSGEAIVCRGLGKMYRLGELERYHALRDRIAEILTAPFRRSHSPNGADETLLWALRDFSLSVKEGEVLGIIGRNGAGKSTLLRVLSRITDPTEGEAEIHGRVGSLLEVGTGFHPELTGRENVYLNGAILGMKKSEIDRKFDEIVAFAEVERFLETPVKRYSTGMQMRLAFAVAAHLEPEILLVDEVLAVGDVGFQKKCLGKMDTVARAGRTILLVSHSMAAIQSLCHRVICLDHGRLVGDGPPEQVIHEYLRSIESSHTERIWTDVASAPGDERARLRRAKVRTNGSELITIETPITLEFEYWNLVEDSNLHLSVLLYNEEGVLVLNAEPVNETVWRGRPLPAGLFRDACTIPGGVLNDGSYYIDLLVVKDEGTILFRMDHLLSIDVHDTAERHLRWYGKWPGVVRPAVEWRTEFVIEGLPSEAEQNHSETKSPKLLG